MRLLEATSDLGWIQDEPKGNSYVLLMQEWKTLSKILEPLISNTFNLSNESLFLNCTMHINSSLFSSKNKPL